MIEENETEITYEEAKEYFNNGNGYLNNLSNDQLELILTPIQDNILNL